MYLLGPRLYLPEFFHSNQISARLDEVHNAINAKSIIHIEYFTLQDDVSERELRPLGLLFWGLEHCFLGGKKIKARVGLYLKSELVCVN